MVQSNNSAVKNDILCAVDFSESSIDALNWAVALARKNRLSLTIMFCYRLIAAMDDEDTIALKLNIEKEAARKFKEYEAKHLKDQQVLYRFIMEVGFYHFRIEMFLKHHPVGMVVIGNTIVQNFDEYKHLGFEKFIKDTQIPVIIVPHEGDKTTHDEKNPGLDQYPVF